MEEEAFEIAFEMSLTAGLRWIGRDGWGWESRAGSTDRRGEMGDKEGHRLLWEWIYVRGISQEMGFLLLLRLGFRGRSLVCVGMRMSPVWDLGRSVKCLDNCTAGSGLIPLCHSLGYQLAGRTCPATPLWASVSIPVKSGGWVSAV